MVSDRGVTRSENRDAVRVESRKSIADGNGCLHRCRPPLVMSIGTDSVITLSQSPCPRGGFARSSGHCTADVDVLEVHSIV